MPAIPDKKEVKLSKKEGIVRSLPPEGPFMPFHCRLRWLTRLYTSPLAQKYLKELISCINIFLLTRSDINLKMVEFLRSLEGFRFHAVIGRKIPEIFIDKYGGNDTKYYFDLIHELLVLHPLEKNTHYHLYLSQRQNNTRQRFAQAFEKVLMTENKDRNISYECTIVRSKDLPELSVVDYLLWALQRYILQGEKRYFAAMAHLYEQIMDLDEDDGKGRLYTAHDQFEVEKASPFIILPGTKK
jgi:hypothetical protein